MNNKKTIRKETKELVFEKIATALKDIKGSVKRKQFDKKLQKASGLLAKEIAKAAKKESPKKAKSKKEKAEKKLIAKAAKSKKAVKEDKTGLAKMNNVPSMIGDTGAPETLIP